MNANKNQLKTLPKNIRLKQRFAKTIDNNNDQSYAVDIIIKMLKRCTILLGHLDQYETEQPNNVGVVCAILVKLLVLMNGFRFFFSSVFNKKWVIILMSDSTYLLGNQKLFTAILGMACFITIIISVIVQVEEMN